MNVNREKMQAISNGEQTNTVTPESYSTDTINNVMSSRAHSQSPRSYPLELSSPQTLGILKNQGSHVDFSIQK